VKLGTGDTSVTLALDGYQLPATSIYDEDRNWLYLRGHVQTESRAWSFRDPCLLTWDAPRVSAWLRAVVDGQVEPENARDAEPDEVFLEPNVAFGLESRSADSARIRFHFSLESLPPWATQEEHSELFKYFVVVTATFDELLMAAAEWDSESAAFPRR
jgi:hypothetical protein